ncbi:alpha/beta hydrolase [Xanthomonas sacchari]|uniref:alpha/beta fold hydrolase n=1 Tax=Xanthomonas sacchari TaxID=56458 RepID=UPI00224F2CBD|nr:alpha/beta hydrolase [Xanthomonas sacchari]MCW0447191.1 2-succinyl-6-hydroxy-2,4-cyclohexadiene-1-carboxylate synthase [Xanthomonas sacchari]MCW0452903.1 2-succinyl-6-hydroxy-2,4-cyclohexadiene-1-carboxylate synthase [Xanthomonas sacchari]
MTESSLHVKVADGLRLHVRTWGGQPPVLLLVHGFGQGSFVWRSLAASMSDYAMAAVDLRGHGESDHDRLRRYALASHVSDVVEVALSLNLQDYVLVGHSLGAAVSILAAQRLPRPRAVVIVDGGPGLSPASSAYIREEFLRLKFRYHSAAEYQQHLEATMPLAAPPLLQTLAIDALQQLGPEEFRLKADRALGYQEELVESLDAALWQALQRMQMPLLLIRGAASSLCSKRWSDDVRARVPHIEIETVARAGHAVMLDNPLHFNALFAQYATRWLGAARGFPTSQP